MTSKGGLVVLGTIAFLCSAAVLSAGAHAQTEGAAATAVGQSGNPPAGVSEQAAGKAEDTAAVGLKAVSQALLNEANRLRTDNAEWDKKLQELQLDIKKNPQGLQGAGGDISDCVVVLGKAADLLAPDSEARKSIRRQETTIREFAGDAAVHSDPLVRKTSAYLEQKGDEIHALAQAAEETRTRILTSIDQLSTENGQIEFNRAVREVAETITDAQATIDNIKSIAAGAQKLASDLDGFDKTAVDAVKPGSNGTSAAPNSSNTSLEERKGRRRRSTVHPIEVNKKEPSAATGMGTATTALRN